MSVSEQEAKQQIAQMRLALESMKASARRAVYVKVIGLILGFAIVGVYVWLIISLLVTLGNSDKWVPLIQQRLAQYNLQEQATKTVTDVVPVYLKEGQKMLQGMNLQDTLMEEGSAFLKDIAPFAQSEAQRVMPQLQAAVLVQANQAAKELETDLQGMLQKRLEAMVAKHGGQIETETGLTEQKAAEIVDSITSAAQQAMLNVVQKRWGDNQKKLSDIADLVDQLPALPPMSEADLLDHMRGTLIALVKYKLPDYDLEAETGQLLVSKVTPLMTPAMRAEDLESKIEGLTQGLKEAGLTEEHRNAMQKQLDQAKKDLDALKASTPPKPATMAPPAPVSAASVLQKKVDDLTSALKQTGLTDEQRQAIQAQLDKAKKEMDDLKSGAPVPAAVIPGPPAGAATPAAAPKPAAAMGPPPASSRGLILQQQIDGYTNALKQPGLTDQARQDIQALLDKAKKDMDAFKSGQQ